MLGSSVVASTLQVGSEVLSEVLRSKHRSSPSARLAAALMLVLLVGGFLALAGAFALYMDDAYISLRYAQNLARGDGLVFNPGEWVEGYSNFSWTVLLAALLRMGIDAVLASRVLGVIFGAASVLAVAWAMHRLRGRLDAAMIGASVLVASSIPLALWSTSGMETSFFTLLVTLAVVHWMLPRSPERTRWGACLLFALASLTRPDGGLFFAAAFLAFLATSWRRRIHEAAIFAGPLAIHLAWKWKTYGELLPNTYYAKAGVTLTYLDRGLTYATDALVPGGVVFLPLMMLSCWHPRHALFARRTAFVLAVVAAYVVAVGGDVLPVQRFWVPLMPLGAVLGALGLESLLGRFSPRAAGLTAPLAGVLTLVVLLGSWQPLQETRREWGAALARMESIGKWFGESLAPDESIAATAIGAIAYHSDRRVIDMLGLTNPKVARDPDPVPGLSDSWKEKRYNAAAILGDEPTVVLFSTGARPSAAGEKALFLYEGFHRAYASFHFRSEPTQATPHVAYRLRPGATVDPLGPRAEDVAFVEEFERGITASQRGEDPDLAITRFESAVGSAPFDFPIAREWLAISRYQAQRPGADAALREVARADPMACVAWRFLGSIALRDGDLDEAQRRFEHLREVEAHEPFGWAGLAEVAARRGEFERARGFLRESLRRWSTNARAQRLMMALEQQ